MNTRLLRASDRLEVGRGRVFRGLGQMQPVIIGCEQGCIVMRIEGVSDGRPCWWRLPLPACRRQAKELFADLEAHRAAGTANGASRIWDATRKAA